MATSRPARARTTQPPGRQTRTHRAATLENARSAQLRERPKTQEGRPPERGVDKEGEQGPGARTRGGRPREGAGPQARGVSMQPLPPDGGQRRKHTLPARGEHRDEAGRTPQRNKSGSMMDQPLKDPAPDGQRWTTATWGNPLETGPRRPRTHPHDAATRHGVDGQRNPQQVVRPPESPMCEAGTSHPQGRPPQGHPQTRGRVPGPPAPQGDQCAPMSSPASAHPGENPREGGMGGSKKGEGPTKHQRGLRTPGRPRDKGIATPGRPPGEGSGHARHGAP